MKRSDSASTDAKPWLAPNAQAGSYALGMLGLEERKLLYHLARNVYSGEGAMVELGAFCGASTCCLAAGLRDNPRAAGRRIHSYDRFVADEPYLVDFLRQQFGAAIEMGDSFEPVFRHATAEFADRIEVHAGDLLVQTWPEAVPIEVLFVDVAKTLALNAKVLAEFVAHLVPGKSILIHQDFYHPTAFYIPVVMDFLWEHFTLLEAGRDWSVVFRLETAIPPDKLHAAACYKFSFARQQAALKRVMRRVGMPGCDYLRLSECAAIGTNFGERRFAAALADAIGQSRLAPDQVWEEGLRWCGDFKASRIRTRIYGAPSLMPAPTVGDKAYLMLSAVAARIASTVKPRPPL